MLRIVLLICLAIGIVTCSLFSQQRIERQQTTDALVYTYYASTRGKDNAPCTKKRPCSIKTGLLKHKALKEGQSIVFIGLSMSEISKLVSSR